MKPTIVCEVCGNTYEVEHGHNCPGKPVTAAIDNIMMQELKEKIRRLEAENSAMRVELMNRHQRRRSAALAKKKK